MEYTKLTEAEQLQILAQRKKQYEAEHFQHSVNKELLVASGGDDEATATAIVAAEDAMAILDSAHAITVEKMDALNQRDGQGEAGSLSP